MCQQICFSLTVYCVLCTIKRWCFSVVSVINCTQCSWRQTERLMDRQMDRQVKRQAGTKTHQQSVTILRKWLTIKGRKIMVHSRQFHKNSFSVSHFASQTKTALQPVAGNVATGWKWPKWQRTAVNKTPRKDANWEKRPYLAPHRAFLTILMTILVENFLITTRPHEHSMLCASMLCASAGLVAVHRTIPDDHSVCIVTCHAYPCRLIV